MLADKGSVGALPRHQVDVTFPDISRWSDGNTGLPHVWTFDSGHPGPHVAVQALTHGNEVCGAIALDFLLEERVRPIRGKLSLCFANVAAYRTWNPAEPFKSRFVDEDYNRVWAPGVLEGHRDTVELRRARELRAFYDTLDHLLDIHSMSDPCAPLMLAGARRKGVDLALALGFPEYVIVDSGHAAGRRLRDYGRFDDPGDPRTALLIECGQHWTQDSPVVAIQSALRFLRHFGALRADFLDRHLDPKPAPRQRIIEVTASVPIRTDAFSFVWPQDGALAIVPNAGSLVATDGDVEIRTPYDGCALVMPMRRRARPGDTAVRLGRFIG
jgi:predicted deacylase